MFSHPSDRHEPRWVYRRQDLLSSQEAAISRLGRGTFRQLVTALRVHPNAFARAVAATSLRRFGARARPALLGALRDPAMPVRLSALRSLEHLWTPRVAPAVIRLLRDLSAGIRHNTSAVLGRHHVVAAARPLVRLLDDPVWHVRQQAARALGLLRADRARVALARAATDPRLAVRKAAKKALEQLGSLR